MCDVSSLTRLILDTCASRAVDWVGCFVENIAEGLILSGVTRTKR